MLGTFRKQLLQGKKKTSVFGLWSVSLCTTTTNNASLKIISTLLCLFYKKKKPLYTSPSVISGFCH